MYFTWPVAPPTKTIPSGYLFTSTRTVNGETVQHGGLDVGGPATGGSEGEPVYAAAPGKVTVSRRLSDPSGYAVYVDHGKEAGVAWQTRYFHVQDPAVARTGDQVTRGQHIANVGKTGIYNSPAHLHFEVRKDGKAVDPLPLLGGSAGTLPMLAAVAAVWFFALKR